MANPALRHLEALDVATAARGSATDAQLRHVAVCEECRNALERERRVGYYLAPPPRKGLKPSKDHVADDVLRALFSNGLSPVRVATVTKHLQACDRCLARYERVRADELASPLPKELTQVASMDLPRLQRKVRETQPASGLIGRLVVGGAGRRVGLAFEPATGADPGPTSVRDLRKAALVAGGSARLPSEPVRIKNGRLELVVEFIDEEPGGLRFKALRDGRPDRSLVLHAQAESLEMTARPGKDGWLRLPMAPGTLRLELRGGEHGFQLDLVLEKKGR